MNADAAETGFEFRRARKRPRAVSLIALIDVAMFLLIFFLVSGTIEKFEIIPIDPPTADSGKLMDEGHILILLGARDEVVIDDDLTDMSGLEQFVRGKLSANPNKVITVKADATVPAVRMIQVMDRIRQAGGKNLSIVTQSLGSRHAPRRP